MKKLILILLLTFSTSIVLLAQVPPQAFNYSSVIRGNNGQALPNKTVSLRLTILENSANGNVKYQEMHLDTTNQFGVVNLEIGKGTPLFNTFSQISWGSASHFLKIELDENGGTNFQTMGTSEFLSVPYALYCGNCNTSSSNDTSATNELQTISISNDTIYLTSGGSVPLNTPTNLSQLTNDVGFVTTSIDADSDPTNEYQFLSVSNDTIFLTNGGFIKLPPSYSGTNTDNQTLSLIGDSLLISNGNGVKVPPLSNDFTVGYLSTDAYTTQNGVQNGYLVVPYLNSSDTMEVEFTVNDVTDVFQVSAAFHMTFTSSSAATYSVIFIISSNGSQVQNLYLESNHHSNGGVNQGDNGSVIVTGLAPGTYKARLMNKLTGAASPGNRIYSGSRHLLVRKI